VNRQGSSADGSSFSDFEKEEKEHKHSILLDDFATRITTASGST